MDARKLDDTYVHFQPRLAKEKGTIEEMLIEPEFPWYTRPLAVKIQNNGNTRIIIKAGILLGVLRPLVSQALANFLKTDQNELLNIELATLEEKPEQCKTMTQENYDKVLATLTIEEQKEQEEQEEQKQGKKRKIEEETEDENADEEATRIEREQGGAKAADPKTQESKAERIMRSQGWVPGGGLGPRGNGRVEPIETVVRPRNVGLGYKIPTRAGQTE